MARLAKLPDRRAPLFMLAVAIFLADRASKWWVARHIVSGLGHVLIPHVFRITHVMNNGAAFSLFAGGNEEHVRWGLIIFSAIAVLLMMVLIAAYGRRVTPATLAFALILGGAAGNLFDRIQLGEVVDFLEFHIGGYHYPDFNFADSAIVIGGLLIFFASFRSDSKKTSKN